MSAGGLIHPVLLSGGSGSRLWPLSRESFPKQLLPLAGELTMLQETASRAMGDARFGPITVIANEQHRFIIAEQLRDVGAREPLVVLEPMARNTCFAAAVAALTVAARDPEGVMLLMPADHVIRRPEAFSHAIDAALPAAREGRLALFGITPGGAATGYGYIEEGEPLAGHPGVFEVARFVEKPDAATAERLVADGRHLWNSGIFLLPARVFLEEMQRLAPDILSAAEAAVGSFRARRATPRLGSFRAAAGQGGWVRSAPGAAARIGPVPRGGMRGWVRFERRAAGAIGFVSRRGSRGQGTGRGGERLGRFPMRSNGLRPMASFGERASGRGMPPGLGLRRRTSGGGWRGRGPGASGPWRGSGPGRRRCRGARRTR